MPTSAAEYAGLVSTSTLVLHPFDTRILQGGAAIGPEPPADWTIINLQQIKVPVIGDYLLHVSLNFDPSRVGYYRWKFQYLDEFQAEYDEEITHDYNTAPPSQFNRVIRLTVQGTGGRWYLSVFYDTTSGLDGLVLPGSSWELTLCGAAGGPLPPDVWCEPFIPQDATDADTLYDAHLERMNDLSITF